ncbi:MAG: oligosaccharide flippase family protein [Patescibacteria group bacterium]
MANMITRFGLGFHQTAIAFVGNFGSAGFSAIALILISRMLGPELFGEFSAAFAIAVILSKINDAGLSVALQKFVGGAKTHAEANQYMSEALRLRLIISASILLVILPFTTTLTRILQFDHPYLVLISIVIGLSIAYYDVLLIFLQATLSFTSAAVANLSQAVLKVLMAVGAYFIFPKALGVIYSLYIGAVLLPVLFSKSLLPSWVHLNIWKKDVKKQKDILSLAKHSAILIVASVVIDNIGVLFVKGYLTSFEAGLLGGASRISLLFILIGASLAQVLYPRIAKYRLKSDLDKYLKKAVIILLLAVVAFFSTIAFSDLAIYYTIGPEYLAGSSVLVVLLASAYIYMATVPFSALFFSFKEPYYFSIAGILQVIVTIGGNMLFVPVYGLMAAAWTQLAGKLLMFGFTLVYSWYAYKKHIGNE